MFSILFTTSAQKELRKLPVIAIKAIKQKLLELKKDPFTMQNVSKLKQKEAVYRLRVGQYRVIYTIEKQINIITIKKIGHRKDAYKNL